MLLFDDVSAWTVGALAAAVLFAMRTAWWRRRKEKKKKFPLAPAQAHWLFGHLLHIAKDPDRKSVV